MNWKFTHQHLQESILNVSLNSASSSFSKVFLSIQIEGGVNGVFEIEELVDVLRKENARDLCVIKMPAELKYVDYLCLVNGTSNRHMIGMSHFVRKCYKLKRHTGDIIPKIEGEKCRNWIAMDLGNIALHIFTPKSRDYYDLESLWCLGEEYEKRVKGSSAKEDLYKKYMEAASASAENNSTLIDPVDHNLDSNERT